ncbi:MAG: ornithine carbamoyltransferase [Gammaproteobacteria bacterium]|nr:ornithine carbamoyltransferase [Gammaproteobacteria bacterium]MYH45755.1 ornithine carbamoyltransferase [Gammaproteobacteria bacterium]MYL12705.1 ornithine carbamoyltransferase [Gammaproteobacteria bacterium]
MRHFLTLNDLPPRDLQAIVQRAMALKAQPGLAVSQRRKTLGLIFEKASTRTRIAFETAMAQMDGASLFIAAGDSQLGRGEPIEDTARVVSRMVDCVAIRTFDHERLERFAAYSRVPVINALSNDFHPCQLLADIQTWQEHRGDIAGNIVAWIGDGNNVCQSYINAAAAFDFELRVCCPEGFEPNAELLAANDGRVSIVREPGRAVRGAQLVVTDVWASMGQEQESADRNRVFAGFQVNGELMAHAAPDALFMHCLPAHRGEEVSAELLDREDSVVWDEAENRMHTQKALLEYLLAE